MSHPSTTLKATRTFVSRAVIALTVIAALASATTAAAQTAPLKKVKFAVGSRVVNIIYPYLTMATALGYWKAEGYDVEIVPLGGSLEAIQQVVAGRVDFAQLNSGSLMQANVDNKLDFRAIMLVSATDWSVVSLASSPIKDIKEFKGKIIGVPSLSSGGMTLLKEYLKANGLEAGVDVGVVPVGFGAPAYEAIRTDKIQGLMFYQTGITGFEDLGARFNKMFSPDWRKMPDFTMATTQRLIDKDPAMVQAIVRGALKGQLFSMANPDCARRVQWKTWPETAPSGAPDEAAKVRWDINLLGAQSNSMKKAYALAGSKNWGEYTPAMAGTLQDFLFRAGMIKDKLPPENFVITAPKFFDTVNAFDVKAVEDQAKACVGF